MTLEEVAHITDTNLTVKPTLTGGFVASFAGLALKDGCILSGACGFGRTEKAASKALAARISGELAVTGGLAGPRSEFNLPTVTP